MKNNKQTTFQNHWLNMQHSVEENLTYSHQPSENASLPVGEAIPAAQDGEAMPVPKDGYALPTDEVMPTLARINQRIAARQRAFGAEATPPSLVAEDAMAVALRAVDKRRR